MSKTDLQKINNLLKDTRFFVMSTGLEEQEIRKNLDYKMQDEKKWGTLYAYIIPIENLTKLLEKLTHTFDTDTDIQKAFVGYDILRYDILDKTLRDRMTGKTNKMIFDVYAGNYDENFAKKCNIDFDETVTFLESFTKEFSNKHNGTIISKDLFEVLKAHMGHSVYIEGQYENENDAFDNPKGITVRCVELDCDDCMKTILRLEKPDEKTH